MNAAEDLHNGFGAAAAECEELRERMKILGALDRSSDKKLYARMLR